jgi:hypothetical protein
MSDSGAFGGGPRRRSVNAGGTSKGFSEPRGRSASGSKRSAMVTGLYGACSKSFRTGFFGEIGQIA